MHRVQEAMAIRISAGSASIALTFALDHILEADVEIQELTEFCSNINALSGKRAKLQSAKHHRVSTKRKAADHGAPTIRPGPDHPTGCRQAGHQAWSHPSADRCYWG